MEATRIGGIAGLIGLTIGAALGVTLVLTGVFAPFGLGVLGAVALASAMGVGAGLFSGGVFGVLAFKNRTSVETGSTLTQDPQSVVQPLLTQESSKKLSKLTSEISSCPERTTQNSLTQKNRKNAGVVSSNPAVDISNPVEDQPSGEIDQFKP
ncbi:hypothetical protein TUM19329_19660 [Legionella antarctica]|uniref:Transmembrane protein n=1 Tax=Legionella antarctica TaxID=2708020 RepID=A0A6F8T4J3_9GAMM|nr:hypothetical protein [Legionella antarctica]BCA95605.1 hypothetical protein TUM19329_19660 [Legionella antarctica]